jgi:CheY-like chemotaxis protein
MTPAPRLRVLIADDDEDQLIVRSLLLECAGFSVTRASDVASALRLAAATQPHCAVVDLRLPGETEGLHLIRELKGMNENLELFVLTGADPKGLLACPERTFVREVLLKPIPSGRLIECLKQVESRAAAGAAREKNG